MIELQLKSFFASQIFVASLDEFDVLNRPLADLFARGRLCRETSNVRVAYDTIHENRDTCCADILIRSVGLFP